MRSMCKKYGNLLMPVYVMACIENYYLRGVVESFLWELN